MTLSEFHGVKLGFVLGLLNQVTSKRKKKSKMRINLILKTEKYLKRFLHQALNFQKNVPIVKPAGQNQKKKIRCIAHIMFS